jgi:ribA/ribD-fused uncharacterized protein
MKVPRRTIGDSNKTRIESDVPTDEILFYRANEKPYGVFSNLYPRTIAFEGRQFPTAEHAYQAGKARKEDVREWILSAPTPSLVAMAAHGLYTWDIVSNWSQIKFDRMRAVLRAKFTQHDDLGRILLSTGNARLVEAARVSNGVNRTWGEVNGKGLNMLGVLLMELRGELRAKEGQRDGTHKDKSNRHQGEPSEVKVIAEALRKRSSTATA